MASAEVHSASGGIGRPLSARRDARSFAAKRELFVRTRKLNPAWSRAAMKRSAPGTGTPPFTSTPSMSHSQLTARWRVLMHQVCRVIVDRAPASVPGEAPRIRTNIAPGEIVSQPVPSAVAPSTWPWALSGWYTRYRGTLDRARADPVAAPDAASALLAQAGSGTEEDPSRTRRSISFVTWVSSPGPAHTGKTAELGRWSSAADRIPRNLHPARSGATACPSLARRAPPRGADRGIAPVGELHRTQEGERGSPPSTPSSNPGRTAPWRPEQLLGP